MDELKLLRVKNAKLKENNNLLYEYIEQNRITHLVACIAELKAEVHKIRNQWHIDLNDKVAFEAENKRLKEALRIGCYCNRDEMIQWLEENKVVSDQPFEKEKTIVLRMFVIDQALKDKC